MKLPIEKLPKPIRRVVDWLSNLSKEFNEDNGDIVAAAISFYIFISIIPLVLVAVAAFGFFMGSQDQSRELLLRQIEQVLPGGKESAQGIKSLLGGIIAGSTPAGIIGFLLLLWSGSAAFVNLGKAMDIAWDSTQQRGFIMQRLVALGVLLAAGLLLVVSFVLTTVANLLSRQEIFSYNLGDIPFVWQIVGYVIPPIITIAMFTIIYKILPTVKVPFKAALVGGVFSGIIWEVLKLAFTFYLTHFANFRAVYGSLATVIILILWIFYSSTIMVLGAEVSQLYARRVLGETRGQETEERRSA